MTRWPRLSIQRLRNASQDRPGAAPVRPPLQRVPMESLRTWNQEQRSAFLYRVCAEAEAGTLRAQIFRREATQRIRQRHPTRGQGRDVPQDGFERFLF